MKLGLHIGYWGLGVDRDEQLLLVQHAEALGYDSVWAAEAYGSDAATVLAWLAASTQKIKLGSAIWQIPGRSAAMTAMTAATLDVISDGRFILGLGTSGPQVSEGWHGQRFGKQLQRTRDYVSVLRMALARERVQFDGETLQLPLPDGPGKALKLTISPVQEKLPIFLAAIGPRNTELAAEIADGWLPTLFSPHHVAEVNELLERGFAKTPGKGRADFQIAPIVNYQISHDINAARDAMRGYLALYIGGMGSKDRNFYAQLATRYGFGDAASRVQDLYLSGDREAAMAALPTELIDAVCLCGDEVMVTRQLASYAAAGVDTLIVSPMAWSLVEQIEQLTRLSTIANDLQLAA